MGYARLRSGSPFHVASEVQPWYVEENRCPAEVFVRASHGGDVLGLKVREVGQDLLRGVRSLGWPPAEDGRVHLLKPYYRPSLWEKAENRSGLPVASDLQLMLDLWNHPMRGRETG